MPPIGQSNAGTGKYTTKYNELITISLLAPLPGKARTAVAKTLLLT
jgi:hypothetical protein